VVGVVFKIEVEDGPYGAGEENGAENGAENGLEYKTKYRATGRG
jgi:hypothetical protein